MTRLRVAVVGAGHLGRIHAGLIKQLPEVELVAVVDPDADARTEVAQACQTRPAARVREILGQIDAAVVAAPTTAHCELGRILLSHNIHVFMEKPLATNRRQARILAALAERNDRVLQVGHIERFNPALRAVAPQLRQPLYIEARRMNGYTFRSTDVGAVLDLMIHDLDLALLLAQSPVRQVHAWGQTVVGGEEDVAQARIEFQNGCVANLVASRVATHCERQMLVVCPSLHAQMDFQRRTVELVHLPGRQRVRLGTRTLPTGTSAGADRQQQLQQLFRRETLPVPQANPLVDELQEFFEAIRTGCRPSVTAEDGCAVVELAEQVLAALREPMQTRHERSAPAADHPCILPVHLAQPHPLLPLRRKAG